MTNIAFRDIQRGSIHVWSKNPELPKQERINKALADLKHTGRIVIYLYKGRKLRVIKTVPHY